MSIVRRNAKIINKTGREITLENGNNIYLVRFNISSNAEDSYNTRMGLTSLDRFVLQANEGVPVCPNHTKEVVMGITSNATKDDNHIVSCDFNIDVDLDFAHPEAGYKNSNDLIRQIKNGRIKMSSVGGGFSPETRLDCNVCGKDQLSDMSCPHWQGVYYSKDEIANEEQRKAFDGDRIKCVPSWEELDLGEASTTYSGANDDANIVLNRANLMLENGLLEKSTAARLNQRYNLQLDLNTC